jgi:hypothetical protein
MASGRFTYDSTGRTTEAQFVFFCDIFEKHVRAGGSRRPAIRPADPAHTVTSLLRILRIDIHAGSGLAAVASNRLNRIVDSNQVGEFVNFLRIPPILRVTVRHKSGKDVTAGEAVGHVVMPFPLPPLRNEEDKRSGREEKAWTGKEIENFSIM